MDSSDEEYDPESENDGSQFDTETDGVESGHIGETMILVKATTSGFKG